MTAARVLVVGDLVTDILAIHSGEIAVGSDTAARISIAGGGSAANTAAWLVQAGARADLVGVAGTERAGDERLAELRASGVGCAWVRRSDEAPTGAIIVLVRQGERSFLFDRGANLLLTESDVDLALAEAGPDLRHLHVSGYTMLHEASRPAGRHALASAAARGLTTSVDAASAAPLRRVGGRAFLDWVGGCDILLANLDEARALLDDEAAAPEGLAGRLASVTRVSAVVKLGAAGAIWASADGGVIRAEAEPAPVVTDPTGAGDAFAAGLLAAWLAGAEPAAAMRAAARLGAAAVGVVGARPQDRGRPQDRDNL